MKAVFADTFYLLALLNRREASHKRAVEVSRGPGLSITTTEFVLLELADALHRPGVRNEAAAVWHLVANDPAFRLWPASAELLHRGLALYRSRTDKDWPLTDCTSFVVMKDAGLRDALTADRHFEQAGFKAVLL